MDTKLSAERDIQLYIERVNANVHVAAEVQSLLNRYLLILSSLNHPVLQASNKEAGSQQSAVDMVAVTGMLKVVINETQLGAQKELAMVLTSNEKQTASMTDAHIAASKEQTVTHLKQALKVAEMSKAERECLYALIGTPQAHATPVPATVSR